MSYEKQARQDRAVIGMFWVSIGIAVALVAFFVWTGVAR